MVRMLSTRDVFSWKENGGWLRRVPRKLEKFYLLAQQIILMQQRAIKSTHMRTSLWTQHSPYSAYCSRGKSSTSASRSPEMTSAG